MSALMIAQKIGGVGLAPRRVPEKIVRSIVSSTIGPINDMDCGGGGHCNCGRPSGDCSDCDCEN